MKKEFQYGNHPRNTMDIYLPEVLHPAKNGVFILLYGGAWTGGDKENISAEAQMYEKAGYPAAAINMRNAFFDEKKGRTVISIFDMLQDIQNAIKKIRQLSEKNGWKITQCAIGGISSGANLAMIYGYSRGMKLPYFDTEEILPVRFVMNVVGPVDMHDDAWFGDSSWPKADREMMTNEGAGPLYARMLTGAKQNGDLNKEELEECIHSMSPVWYVECGGGLPTIMGYSRRDVIQNPNNGKRLQRYLMKQNLPHQLFTFEKSIHGYTQDPKTAEDFFDATIQYANTYFEA